jgi:hypothetical protein
MGGLRCVQGFTEIEIEIVIEVVIRYRFREEVLWRDVLPHYRRELGHDLRDYFVDVAVQFYG